MYLDIQDDTVYFLLIYFFRLRYYCAILTERLIHINVKRT
jgi:hypothetical protein